MCVFRRVLSVPIILFDPQISGVAKKTRSDDLPRVKGAIIELVDIKDADHVLRDKTARGFNNVSTGRLLCPVSDIDEFDEDPSQYDHLCAARSGLILLLCV